MVKLLKTLTGRTTAPPTTPMVPPTTAPAAAQTTPIVKNLWCFY